MTYFRVWSELLPYEVARAQDTLALLALGQLNPVFAVSPEADLDELAGLLRDVSARGLEAGIWPLLTDEQGYWPSERNGADYFERVVAVLEHLKRQGASPQWVAVDLEPPLHQVNRLRHMVGPFHLTVLELLRENLDIAQFQRSVAQFQAGLERVRACDDVKVLSVTLPMAAHDLRDGTPLWQDLFEAPWEGVGWERAGIMAYGSMVAGYSRGWLSEADARAIHYRLFLHLARHFKERAHVSLGVTGVGKLKDEPVYASASALALDVSAAKAAGIDDIAIFCLEGLVGREDAGHWVQTMTQAQALAPPMTARANGVRLGGLLGRQALRLTRHQLNRGLRVVEGDKGD